MKRLFTNLRFRTRLALVMFLTMALTSAVLMGTYVQHNRRIKSYVAGQTSDLLQIIQLAQLRIPPDSNRNQALEAYLKALKDAGLSSITVTSPSGEIVASTTPGQLPGTTIKLKKNRRAPSKQDPIKISAELHDVEIGSSVEQKQYTVEFPIVQGEKVLGYALVRGEMDEVQALLRQMYVVRLTWILATMLAGMFAIVYLAFRFTKPIDMLVDGAQQVAEGNLYVSLPLNGSDEMARLAKTFNEMVGRLRESRELADRLNEAEKHSLLGRFAATVAHEVRNSLNFINLSIDQIRAKHSAGDERTSRDLQRNLARIKDEVNRLNRLVNEFLTAGRQAPPSFAECDIREVLNEVLTLVEKQAQRQNIVIETDLPGDMPSIQADPAQIKTCFLNIITNAIQAMPKGGRISVSALCKEMNGRDDVIEMRFADTGPGISPADRERVFAPYFSTKETGFGLGLAITKKIVEDHGGRIYATDGQMPGTVMVIELPLTRAAASRAALSSPAA